MDEITVHGGIRGTRILAGALATMLLRKRGALNKYIARKQCSRRPWPAGEVARARQLRVQGYTFAEIGAALDRTKSAVQGQLGRRTVPNSATLDAVRRVA